MAWFASWLWEGVVIVLLVSAMLRGLRRVDAATRYAIWWGTLLAIICWPAVTLARFLAQTFLTFPLPTARAVSAAGAARRHLVEVVVPQAPVWALRAAVGIWLVSVIWKLSRLAVACWQLRRVKRSCTPLSAAELDQLPLWRKVSQRGRVATLCVSDQVGVACALGFREPIIALPKPFLDQLGSRDLDQVTLHEYAHLQRRDDWARLVQLAVDAVCGWHPAIRWISRQLTFEREVACDDWVVQRTHDPLGYARCLTNLAERTIAGQATTLSPAAWSSEPVVVRRVQRVLEARRNAAPSASRWRLAVAVAVVALMAGEAGRVFALQDATDRIVAATPIAGSLNEAVTAEAFGGLGRHGTLPAEPVAPAMRTAAIAPTSHLPVDQIVSESGSTTPDRATTADSARLSNADLAATSASAFAGTAGTSRDAAGANIASSYGSTNAAAAAGTASSPVPPALQHPVGNSHTGDDASSSPLGSAPPHTGFAPLDISASLDDLVLDDDVDHDEATPALDQPTHNSGVASVRAARPRTRGTGFFARVGRSIAHILGTKTRSPGGLPDARRGRA